MLSPETSAGPSGVRGCRRHSMALRQAQASATPEDSPIGKQYVRVILRVQGAERELRDHTMAAPTATLCPISVR
eukprot:11153938-Lingulodinium_polyedra.AAC.1